jgi:hypothetical protein
LLLLVDLLIANRILWIGGLCHISRNFSDRFLQKKEKKAVVYCLKLEQIGPIAETTRVSQGKGKPRPIVKKSSDYEVSVTQCLCKIRAHTNNTVREMLKCVRLTTAPVLKKCYAEQYRADVQLLGQHVNVSVSVFPGFDNVDKQRIEETLFQSLSQQGIHCTQDT